MTENNQALKAKPLFMVQLSNDIYMTDKIPEIFNLLKKAICRVQLQNVFKNTFAPFTHD